LTGAVRQQIKSKILWRDDEGLSGKWSVAARAGWCARKKREARVHFGKGGEVLGWDQEGNSARSEREKDHLGRRWRKKIEDQKSHAERISPKKTKNTKGQKNIPSPHEVTLKGIIFDRGANVVTESPPKGRG